VATKYVNISGGSRNGLSIIYNGFPGLVLGEGVVLSVKARKNAFIPLRVFYESLAVVLKGGRDDKKKR